MKNILLASTALVATAGFAAAEGHEGDSVSFSGSAEMGIIGGSDIENQFHTDIDITFTLSGTTDNGLTFGADIDLDESSDNDAFTNTTQGGESIFISGDFGTLTMGDTDGAFDWALTEAIIGGTINDDHEHVGYNGNAGLDGLYDGQVARYDYVGGNFGVAVSAEINDGTGEDPVWGIGVTYDLELGAADVGFGVAYQTADGAGDDAELIGVSVDANFDNGFQVIASYQEWDLFGQDIEHIGLALGYSMDALTIGVNYGEFDFDGVGEAEGIGLAVNYDLGGGLEAQFGYGDNDLFGTEFDTFSLGVAMSF